jgi:excinuclease ABC subunit C
LPPHSSALQLIQYIRDEAHRFALAGHRGQRMKARSRSQLEAVPGIGPGRRRVLLKQFGGLQGVERAGVDELAKVPGINKELAQRIYDTLHGE